MRIRRKVFFVFTLILLINSILLASNDMVFSKSGKGVYILGEDQQLHLLSPGFPVSFTVVDKDRREIYAADSSGLQLAVYDLSTSARVGTIQFTGKIINGCYDSFRRAIYAVDQTNNQIYVIDTATRSIKNSIALPKENPLSVDCNMLRGEVYVGFADTVLAFSADKWSEIKRLEDMEDAALAIGFNNAHDRLIIQHKNSISIYSLSTFKFIDFLPLEEKPSKIQVRANGKALAVQLADEAKDNIAIFDLETLRLTDWISNKNKRFQGRSINTDSFYLDEQTDQISFVSESSGIMVQKSQMESLSPLAPTVLPPGVTGSNEFGINPNTDAGVQGRPRGQFDAAGNFVVGFTDFEGADGSGQGIFVHEFDADLTGHGDYKGNQVGAGQQSIDCVAVANNGDFVLMWRDDTRDGAGLGWGVYGRRFSKGGTPKANDFLIPVDKAGKQQAPAISSDASGNYVTAWSGPHPNDPVERGVVFRRWDSAGNALTGDLLANILTAGSPWNVEIAENDAGQFVIVWRDGQDNRIRGRAYHANGNPVAGSNFQAGPYNQGALNNFAPSVGIDSAGNFAVVWQEQSSGGVVGERFNMNQNSLGKFIATSVGTGSQWGPSISMAPGGSFIVTWRDGGYATPDVYARLFDSSGNPIGNDFEVPIVTGNDEFEANAAMSDSGNFLITWKDKGATPSVTGRHFSFAGGSSLSIDDVSIAEGNSGTKIATFTVTLSPASSSTVTVDYATQDGTATAGSDYVQKSGALQFNPGQTQKTVDITINGDTTVEPDENFFVNLTNAVNATISDGQGVGTILDDDTPPTISINDISVIESSGGTTTADFTISLSQPFSQVVSVQFNTEDGTAVAPADYLASTIPVVFPIGETEAVVQVVIIGDLESEGIENFFGKLTNAVNATIADDTGTCNIIDDECLFCAEFEDGILDPDWIYEPNSSAWVETGGSLTEIGIRKSKAIASPAFSGCGGTCSVLVSWRVSGTGNNVLSLFAFYQDSKNYVELKMKERGNKWSLKKKVGGSTVAKKKVSGIIDPDTDYDVLLLHDGSQFIVSVNGTQILTLTASPPAAGTVGVQSRSGAGTFHRLVVLP